MSFGADRLVELEAVYQKWYELRDLEPIHVTLAAVTANLADGDPFWLLLVAPPGSMKTEFIRALNGCPFIYSLSSLTPHTFASGYQSKDEEPSLLMKLDQKIITLKDFTSVLAMHRDARGEILGQLREIYDGAYKKQFGNGRVVDWTGRIGLIAGVTPIVDTYSSVHQALGERFVLYRLAAADGRTVARRAMRQRGTETGMREELRQAVAAFFAELVPLNKEIPEPILDRLCALAEFTARARSGVIWDHRGEIEYIPEAEGPGRLAKQLASLASGLAIVRDSMTVTVADYLTVFKTAQDCVPAPRRAILQHLVTKYADEPQETPAIAVASGYPTNSARRYLLELAGMKLVERLPAGSGRADRWCLSSLAAHLLDDASPVRLATSGPIPDTTTVPAESRESGK